ncbi:thioredoxin TrxA [Vagococcus acidifermentans]|uniref:Thiol reductase thioredoxin n=1 Tax=Vagococcus acidifermentans TaxID=564710 RepID=A0A430AZB3_9ENTE|nr:thioredoxin domain-containing protein [Vagococcus acidifermentans]RSU13398.1 thiol reductase thioredoxin [Vagococcus acidifermentans]
MIELTLENFDEEVTDNSLPVLVDWWGESCENCLALMPVVEELAAEYGDSVHFTKFNTSQKKVRRFCIKHKILGLPVISLYKNGEKVAELSQDDCNKEAIEAMIKTHL